MIINQVTAIRVDNKIEVTILADLPNTCRRAKITDHYPGGNIVYIRDPGEAQVFITESGETDQNICLDVLVPWVGNVVFEDKEHKEVGIYVNKKKRISVKIAGDVSYSVYELTGGIVPPDPEKPVCYIWPDIGVGHHPFKRVFGPDNYKACSEWVLRAESKFSLA